MRRVILLAVIVGVMLLTGVSQAQEEELAKVPDKVMKVLSNIIGTWNVESSEAGGDTMKGTMTAEWGVAGQFVISNDGFSRTLFGWDGLSEDGIVMYRIGMGGFHHIIRAKIVSDTVIEGRSTVVKAGQTFKDRTRVVKKGPDKMVFTAIDEVNGESMVVWKGVYTRTKTTNAEQELIQLEHDIAAALIKQDVATLDSFAIDDITIGTSEGIFMTEKQGLGYVASDNFGLSSMACEDLKVRIYGGTAIVTGTIKGVDKDGETKRDIITDTFVKKDGRWQMVATHSSHKAATKDELQEELKQAEKKMWQAMINADIETLEHFFADEFVGLYDDQGDGNDPIWSKTRLLSAYESGELNFISYQYDEMNIRVNGNFAAITGVLTTKEYWNGRDISGQHRVSSTWVKRSDGWKLLGDNYVRIK